MHRADAMARRDGATRTTRRRIDKQTNYCGVRIPAVRLVGWRTQRWYHAVLLFDGWRSAPCGASTAPGFTSALADHLSSRGWPGGARPRLAHTMPARHRLGGSRGAGQSRSRPRACGYATAGRRRAVPSITRVRTAAVIRFIFNLGHGVQPETDLDVLAQSWLVHR